jgi:hypothetical protein
MDKDLEHLKLLSIFQYIVGGLACFCGLLWTIYVVSGVILVMTAGSMGGDDRIGASIGGMVAMVVGVFLFVLFEVYGILCIIVGKEIREA